MTGERNIGAEMLWLLSAATAGFSAVMQTSSIRARLSEPACYAPQMVSLIETSGSEAEVWLQAFAPYAALATLKISIALTSEDPTKRATPQGIAVWVALSGGVYAAIIYRTLHPVGAEPELLSALADLVVPPVAAAEDVLTAAQRVSDTEGLKLLGLGNAAKEGDIGMRPTIGGVNLFVFYVIYQVAFMYMHAAGDPRVAHVHVHVHVEDEQVAFQHVRAQLSGCLTSLPADQKSGRRAKRGADQWYEGCQREAGSEGEVGAG